jgi:two-component system nitrogen regulation response regulator NtrX
MTILIVEDEPKVQQLLKSHFESRGHQVHARDSGEEAIEALRQHRPETILLDLWLKGKLNGVGVLKEIKRSLPQAAVIVITGLDEAPDEEVFKLGITAFLKKPIRLEELDRLLASA